MYRIVEAFSGIGSQAKALARLRFEFEIVKTIEWDINAICAYDIIHNKVRDDSFLMNLSKEDLITLLGGYSLSVDGKKKIDSSSLKSYSFEALRRIYGSIIRNNNLVSIKDVKGNDIPNNIDILTYSFPCQDLSICGFWHGNQSGIERNACNRSGMLWEVERILLEMFSQKKSMPRILLMENVSNILSDVHKNNFNEWKNVLESMGYYNKIYALNSRDFGVPQNRVRVFMISIFKDGLENSIFEEYFEMNNLEIMSKVKFNRGLDKLAKFLRLDYSNPKYLSEAIESQPNDTPSRRKIYEDSIKLADRGVVLAEYVSTITTKQDRNPNSGIIVTEPFFEGKSNYRNLTPRECFLLMGFDENDYELIIANNFKVNKTRNFFTQNKLIKMAGNSIVVNVLVEIFGQIDHLLRHLDNINDITDHKTLEYTFTDKEFIVNEKKAI